MKVRDVRSSDRAVGLQAPTVRVLAIGLGLLVACGGNPLPEWKTSPTPSLPNAKRVDHLEKVTNTLAWQRSRYFRVDDTVELPV